MVDQISFQISCLDCSVETGKIAAAYDDRVVIFEPTPLRPIDPQQQGTFYTLDKTVGFCTERSRLTNDPVVKKQLVKKQDYNFEKDETSLSKAFVTKARPNGCEQ